MSAERGSAGSRESRCKCGNASAPEILSKGFPALALSRFTSCAVYTAQQFSVRSDSRASTETRLQSTGYCSALRPCSFRKPHTPTVVRPGNLFLATYPLPPTAGELLFRGAIFAESICSFGVHVFRVVPSRNWKTWNPEPRPGQV